MIRKSGLLPGQTVTWRVMWRSAWLMPALLVLPLLIEISATGQYMVLAATYQLTVGFEGREIQQRITPGKPPYVPQATLDPNALKNLAPPPLPVPAAPSAAPTSPSGFYGTTTQETSGLNFPNGFEFPAVVLPLKIRDQFDPANRIPGSFGGPTALAMVLEFHGLNLTTNQVDDHVHATLAGTSNEDLARAARELGFQGIHDGQRKTIAALRAEVANGYPVIVNFTTAEFPGGHYAVVSGFTPDNKIILLEPAHGVRKEMDIADFERDWHSPGDVAQAVFVRPKA